MPEGDNFAAVFPITPPAFKIIASIGSFISVAAFLTEFASVTSGASVFYYEAFPGTAVEGV
jgi:hypothetical protein